MEAWVEDEAGERLSTVPSTRMTLKARVAFMVDVEDPSAACTSRTRSTGR